MRLFTLFNSLTLVILSVRGTIAIPIGPSNGDVAHNAANKGSDIAAQIARRAEIKVGRPGRVEARSKTTAKKPPRAQNWSKMNANSNVRGTHLGCSECTSTADCARCTETLQEKSTDYRELYKQQSEFRAQADALKAQHDAALKERFSVLSRRDWPKPARGPAQVLETL